MNGWRRIPATTRARVQVENYLLSLGAPTYNFATVLRLARHMEVWGIARRDVRDELARLGHPDLTNVVLNELDRRDRQLAKTRPVFRLQPDGTLAPTGEVRTVR
jgi:hypothetical protein